MGALDSILGHDPVTRQNRVAAGKETRHGQTRLCVQFRAVLCLLTRPRVSCFVITKDPREGLRPLAFRQRTTR